MANRIEIGNILIAEGTFLPDSLQLESEPYAHGWRLIKNLNSSGVDQAVGKAGWNFFYVAGVIETTALGSDDRNSTRKAIKQVIAKIKLKKFNCLEITRVAMKRFLGVPYVSVSAHARHIQESQFLSA